jgi:tetratricopeptide (TPR) repeat protein
MTRTTESENRLTEAISLRQAGRNEDARLLLLELHAAHPEDAAVNLQCASVHDKLGLEPAAVSFYEKALTLGLDGDDLRHALLGLGSTYRAIGQYERAVSTLRRGTERFPDHRGMQVFLGLALYNAGQEKEACQILLRVLAETSGDPEVSAYREALMLYAEDLDRTW